MNASVRKFAVQAVAMMCVVGLTVFGCASTKNVMNKATFGLIGGDDKKADDSQQANAAQPQEETKAERKAREKEEKQQRKAEEQAKEDQEKAAKAAEKEQAKQDKEEKPGLMNRMTFGLVGGEKKSDEEKQKEEEAKAAEEQQKQQEKDARRKQEREEKAQKEAEKQAAKDEKEKAKAEEKTADAKAEEEKAPGEKRSLMSKMTFGLVGDKKSEEQAPAASTESTASTAAPEAAATPAAEPSKEDEKAQKQAEKEQREAEKQAKKDAVKAEKDAAKQAKADEKAAEQSTTEEQPKEKRSLMSKMTFGLVGGKEKEEKIEPLPAAAPAAPADTAAATPAPEAAASTPAPEAAASTPAPEVAATPAVDATKPAEGEQKPEGEQPKEKRSLMSKMTFGLVGGKDKEEKTEDPATGGTTEVAANTPVQPALPPEQAALAAAGDAQYDVQPASALDGEARKLAKMSYKTTVDLSTKSASGKGQATASRETYSKSGYGITDIGDVRIAVQGMTFDGESRGGGVVISSDDRAAAGGKSGKGNDAFIYEYAKGVTAVQFGTVNFTISKCVISIGGKSVPIGQGKKLIVVDGQGNVIGAYAAE